MLLVIKMVMTPVCLIERESFSVQGTRKQLKITPMSYSDQSMLLQDGVKISTTLWQLAVWCRQNLPALQMWWRATALS